MKLKAALITTLFGLSAQAATSGTLYLEGVVAPVYSIVVTASGNTGLNITGGETAKTVGSVREVSNNPDGYKISASSQNGGLLSSGRDSVSYSIQYDGGSAVNLNSKKVVKTVSTLAAASDVNSAVKITFAGKATALAGTFSDTITFEIAAP